MSASQLFFASQSNTLEKNTHYLYISFGGYYYFKALRFAVLVLLVLLPFSVVHDDVLNRTLHVLAFGSVIIMHAT